MSTRTPDTYDDNHTVADMSGVRGARQPLWRASRAPESGGTSQGDIADELQDSKERIAVMLGTLKAALSIGAVYVVVFGLVIALLVLLWT